MRSNASLKMKGGGGGHHKRKSMPDSFKTMNNNDTMGMMSSGSIDVAKGFY